MLLEVHLPSFLILDLKFKVFDVILKLLPQVNTILVMVFPHFGIFSPPLRRSVESVDCVRQPSNQHTDDHHRFDQMLKNKARLTKGCIGQSVFPRALAQSRCRFQLRVLHLL